MKRLYRALFMLGSIGTAIADYVTTKPGSPTQARSFWFDVKEKDYA